MINNPFTEPEFLIKLFMICILIFVVHSIVFKYYINDLMKETFKENINEVIDINVKPEMEKIMNNPIMKILINLLPANIKNAYNKESEQTTLYNKYLFFNLLCINIIIITILFIFIYIYKVTCNVDINFIDLIITNIISIIIIAYIEYKFFINTMNKYTPILPSKISETFAKRMKENIQ